MGNHAAARSLVAVLLLTLPLLGAGNEQADAQPRSLKAKAAIKKFDRAVEKADAAHRKAVADAGKVLLAELDAAKRDAMKAANLPEATAIQSVANETEQRLADLGGGGKRAQQRPATGLKGMVGTWLVRYGNGVEREYTIAPDGRVTMAGGPTAPLAKGDGAGVLLDFNDGKIERLHLLEDLLVIEHYNPKSTIKSGRFEFLGVARRE